MPDGIGILNGGGKRRFRPRAATARRERLLRRGSSKSSTARICGNLRTPKSANTPASRSPRCNYHLREQRRVLTAILEAAASHLRGRRAGGRWYRAARADRLERLCQAIYELSSRHVPVVRVAHAAYFGPPEGMPAFDFALFDRVLTGAVERIVQDGQASGELRQAPVRELTLAILGLIAACLRRPQPTGPDLVRSVVNLVFDGIKEIAPRRGSS